MSWVLVTVYAPPEADNPIVNVYGPFDKKADCKRIYEHLDIDDDPHSIVFPRRTIDVDLKTGFVR